jgi:hypothetical protein
MTGALTLRMAAEVGQTCIKTMLPVIPWKPPGLGRDLSKAQALLPWLPSSLPKFPPRAMLTSLADFDLWNALAVPRIVLAVLRNPCPLSG